MATTIKLLAGTSRLPFLCSHLSSTYVSLMMINARKRLAWLFRYYGVACLAQAAIRIRRPIKMTALGDTGLDGLTIPPFAL